jgi:hypothetical protein
MSATIRLATSSDAPAWLDLLRVCLGNDYVDPRVYDPAWIASQLDVKSGNETWVAETGGCLASSITVLAPASSNRNPVANLGRHLCRPESFGDGSAESLLRKMNTLAAEKKQMSVGRVLVFDNSQQILYENLGYICSGYQPSKHMRRVREGTLFYLWFDRPDFVPRLPLSESLPQISELATSVLESVKIPNPFSVRDGVTGYPLRSELTTQEVTFAEYERCRTGAQSMNPPAEISGGYSLGVGLLRMPPTTPPRGIMALRDGGIVAGLAYLHDEQDRCVRFLDAFSSDDISAGALLAHAIKIAHDQLHVIYVEADILMSAPRLLKSAEQLAFVPVSYFPSLCAATGSHADVVKMVKFNVAPSPEESGAKLTVQARRIVEIIDRNLRDQKTGVAIIHLLCGLPIFEGLGDGELRKIARLFTQKLYRAGEKVFARGDSGNEAYVVMRGQIDIHLEDNAKPLASVGNGQIFGELAFLDNLPRTAHAVAAQPSILLVIPRSEFNQLMHREPHLGMVVMRNVATELSNRLRRTNAALTSTPK